jgi:predicted DNA-binding transcriptional regulator YafY
MRASRLLSALMLLQARREMSARELADELGVSIRTVYRDMSSLQTAGIPIYADPGRAGGYRLLDGYRTRLTGLTTEEAQALFLTGVPKAADDLGLGAVVAGAERKLEAALPPELRQRAETVRARFHLDAPGWYDDGEATPHLGAIAGAVWEQRRVAVLYRRWKEPTIVRRVLDPLGVVLKAGRWYLVARSDGDAAPRTYRVGQILEAEVTAQSFDRPADFDLGEHWHAGLAGFRERLQQGEAVIRLSPRGRDRAADAYPASVMEAMRRTETPPDSDGWVTATVPIESLTHAESEFLKLGRDVEVVSPVELRDRIAATSRDLAAMYSVESA